MISGRLSLLLLHLLAVEHFVTHHSLRAAEYLIHEHLDSNDVLHDGDVILLQHQLQASKCFSLGGISSCGDATLFLLSFPPAPLSSSSSSSPPFFSLQLVDPFSFTNSNLCLTVKSSKLGLANCDELRPFRWRLNPHGKLLFNHRGLHSSHNNNNSDDRRNFVRIFDDKHFAQFKDEPFVCFSVDGSATSTVLPTACSPAGGANIKLSVVRFTDQKSYMRKKATTTPINSSTLTPTDVPPPDTLATVIKDIKKRPSFDKSTFGKKARAFKILSSSLPTFPQPHPSPSLLALLVKAPPKISIATDTQWHVPPNPYLSSSSDSGSKEVYLDQTTSLIYPTDISSMLASTAIAESYIPANSSSSTSTSFSYDPAGDNVLVGLGQYTRTVFKVKVYGVALYVNDRHLANDPAMKQFSGLTEGEIVSHDEYFALFNDMGGEGSSGFDRSIMLKLNMQLGTDTMRNSLHTDWKLLTPEHKQMLISSR